MKRRSGEVQVFSMSFLDVLSCALGGTLLLLLLIQDGSQQQADAQEEALREMQSRIDSAQQKVKQAQRDIEEANKKSKNARARARALAAANKKLKQAQTSLTGINGKLKHVVFIFDTSGSMADNFNTSSFRRDGPKRGPKFQRYLAALKRGVDTYPFTRFNVIRFSTDVRAWKPGKMGRATDENKKSANAFIDKFQPNGGTATLKALQAAFRLPDVDTIILYSDGVPVYSQNQSHQAAIKEVMDWLQANRREGLVINTVAIGGSHRSLHREFLRKIAELTKGTAQAIF